MLGHVLNGIIDALADALQTGCPVLAAVLATHQPVNQFVDVDVYGQLCDLFFFIVRKKKQIFNMNKQIFIP